MKTTAIKQHTPSQITRDIVCYGEDPTDPDTTLRAKVRPAAVGKTTQLAMADLHQIEADEGEEGVKLVLAQALDELVVSWDLTTPDGTPVPPIASVLVEALPTMDLVNLLAALGTEMQAVPFGK